MARKKAKAKRKQVATPRASRLKAGTVATKPRAARETTAATTPETPRAVKSVQRRSDAKKTADKTNHVAAAPLPLFSATKATRRVTIVTDAAQVDLSGQSTFLYQGRVESLLKALPRKPLFDLVVTSPPYNIGKAYEVKQDFVEYIAWQAKVIAAIAARLKPSGSLCWQVGNFVENGSIQPLDIVLAPMFYELGFKLRNRIVWHFGHGLHTARRFSGRYEVVLWFTKSDDYVFNLDAVRVPSKYPGKRHYKGPKAGQFSGHPQGKNPEDVWEIPNVKSNHVEKTIHPCQFPVGLIERLVLALTNPGGVVFDPFAGVASAGVAALLHDRVFWGAEPVEEYVRVGAERLSEAAVGTASYRPHDKPLYDHTKSPLSRLPKEMEQ